MASGLLEAEARELNIGFVARMMRGRPGTRVKLAASLDGKTALNNGSSQWLTGPAARRDGHAGARGPVSSSAESTVLVDDPQLNVRDVDTPRQPLKVVVDSRLKLGLQARLFDGSGSVLIASASGDGRHAEGLRTRGAGDIGVAGWPWACRSSGRAMGRVGTTRAQ